jgi:hypothetical protein
VIASKESAFKFLASLEEALNERLPDPGSMRAEVRDIVADSREQQTSPHKRKPEDAFLHHFVFPVLFEAVQTVGGFGAGGARESLLSEFHTNFPEWASTTPARPSNGWHPFQKVFNSDPAELMARWKQGKLYQACPDFALRAPFPHKIVFEGKYFERGSAESAERELVVDAYQAVFYRALPAIAATSKSRGWDYDYSCLLAYDASVGGHLLNAWTQIPENVRQGFWDGGNVYVMILRGNDTGLAKHPVSR